jgi:hypothetical protein
MSQLPRIANGQLPDILNRLKNWPSDPEFEIQEQIQMRQVKRCLEDLKWRSWIKTPEAMVEILRDPKLLTIPSERSSDRSAQDILDMIRARQQVQANTPSTIK